MADSNPYRNVRSILETPILNDHKWGKLPSLPTDAVLVDMEDSVPPEAKEEARARVLATLANPGAVAGKLLIPRVNDLSTPWGHKDLEELARAKVPRLAYPKVRSGAELAEVQTILRSFGGDPDLFAVIETAQGVLELTQIAAMPGVKGLLFGPSDLATDSAAQLYDHSGDYRSGLNEDLLSYARAKLALSGAAYDLAVFDIPFMKDLKNIQTLEVQAQRARAMGMSGMCTFYPPHLDTINRCFTPSPAELTWANQIVRTYENGLANGHAAVTLNGRAIIVQDYKNAQRLLDNASKTN